jgi:hypothetical protein
MMFRRDFLKNLVLTATLLYGGGALACVEQKIKPVSIPTVEVIETDFFILKVEWDAESYPRPIPTFFYPEGGDYISSKRTGVCGRCDFSFAMNTKICGGCWLPQELALRAWEHPKNRAWKENHA